MLHELLKVWFEWVKDWGYLGVFVLMAMESSIFPVPSEVVMPPAAFWAAQGKFSFWGVVLAGTAGSWFGSAVTSIVARVAGAPLVKRYGKWFLLGPDKVALAEGWIRDFGVAGVFVARLLPVVRHLISIPAGLFKMSFVPFSVVTTVGAFLWCAILSWFGEKVIGDRPELLDSPEALVSVMKERLIWFVGAVVVLGILYFIVKRGRRTAARSGAQQIASP
jgi:membrane protein DedA with SNARE-associated domain